jgi:hypothetical protein
VARQGAEVDNRMKPAFASARNLSFYAGRKRPIP